MQEQAIAEEQNADAISQMAENTNQINELIKQAKQLSKNLSDSAVFFKIENGFGPQTN